MAVFEIPVIHPYLEKTRKRIIFLHILSACVLLINAYGMIVIAPNVLWVAIFSLLTALLLFFRGLFPGEKITTVKSNMLLRILTFIAFILNGSYLILQHYFTIAILQFVIAGGIGIISFVEYQVLSPAFVLLSAEAIYLPGTFGKYHTDWSDINSIILRRDLLTLNFNDNRFFQLEMLDELPAEERTALENFIQEQITARRK